MKIEDFESLDLLRAALKRDLDQFPPGEMFSTSAMVERVLAQSGAEPKTAFLGKLLYDAVKNHPLRHFPHNTTQGELQPGKGYMKNKMVRPTLWHRAQPPCPECGGTGIEKVRP